MIRSFVKDIIRFFILVFVQVLVLNNVDLGGLINPYLYILFILLLPFETPRWMLLILAFATGYTIDYFSDLSGFHAAACVFIGFIRPSILKVFAPRDGYEKAIEPNIYEFGFKWYLKYAVSMTLVHHFLLFYLEVFHMSDFFITLARVLISSIFTVILIILSQYIFYRK